MYTEQKRSQHEFSTLGLQIQRAKLDTPKVAESLSAGLTLLRNLLLRRLHEDVEGTIGVDPLLAPVSSLEERKQIHRAKIEIDIYASVVASDEVSQGGYISASDEQFSKWLFRLRMSNEHEPLYRRRVEEYALPSVEERRIKFLSHVEQAMPESLCAPLVLFRLFPRAVRISTALAFGDALRARELRAQQCAFLPAVGDCFGCHGRVLDNGESCRVCANPVWEFSWLLAD